MAPDASRGAARLVLPLALAAGVLAAVLLCLPERTYGDDCFFVLCIVRDRPFPVHFLYMPLARVWTRAFAELGVDPFLALRLLSATGAAAGTALLAAAARRRGARAALPAALALLVLTSNSTWFFAGAAEPHAVHLAACGLLAWTLAGFGPRASPWRALGVALVFGLAVGAHKSTGLLLPGVLAGYALATPGRARAARVRDAALFAAGGALSLAGQTLALRLATGSATSPQDEPSWWLDNIPQQIGNLAPGPLSTFLGQSLIAPAFALSWLGAVAAGSLLRTRARVALALWVAVLPHLAFFPLFGWVERGAYYIPLLPLFAWAAARAAAGSGAPRGAAQKAFTASAVAVAAAGAVLTPHELLAALGPAGLCALLAAGCAGGFLFPRHAWLPPGRAALVALALAACQLAGSQRDLRAWNAEDPLLDWGRDAVEATGAGNALICAGYEQYMLMLLLDRPWPEPYAGTWDYARSLGELGPSPYDAGFYAPELVAGAERLLAEGRRVFVQDLVFQAFEHDPVRGAGVRALRERFTLVPVEHGSFSGFELRR